MPMASPSLSVVLDTGPLSHLAQADALDILEQMRTASMALFFPRIVEAELRQREDLNSAILDSDIATVLRFNQAAEEAADALRARKFRVAAPLSSSGIQKDAGEASCITYAEYLGQDNHIVVYIDDGRGRHVARARGLICLTTTDLLACLVRLGLVERRRAEEVIDALLAKTPSSPNGYSLPVSDSRSFVEAYELVAGFQRPIQTKIAPLVSPLKASNTLPQSIFEDRYAISTEVGGHRSQSPRAQKSTIVGWGGVVSATSSIPVFGYPK